MCPTHQRAESFTLPGVEGQLRFCQKCCKPQLVAEFSGPNRCCATKLAAYNARRRDATVAAQRERAAHGEAGAAGAAGAAASSLDAGLFRGNSVPSSTPSLEGSFSLAAGGDESPCGSMRAVAEAEAVELEPVPRMQPPTSAPGYVSLKLSHATPVTLPPGLAAALSAARMFLPASSPLALSGTPMPGCTLLVLDAFGDSGAVDENDNAAAAPSCDPAACLYRLLHGTSPAAAFLRAQPSLRFENGRGGVAAAAFGQVSEGSTAAVDRLPPPSSLAVLLPAAQHRDAHMQPTLRLIGGSPLPAGLRCRLHGQWVSLSRSVDGVAFSLPPLPPGREGVALFDVGGSGVSLAPPRPLLLLRCPDAVSEVEHTAASLLACERDAASSASPDAVTAAAARRRAVEDALIAIGLALQPSASPALVAAAAQHALFMRWPACTSRALLDLAAAYDETGGDASHPASLSRLLSGTHGASFLHAAAVSGDAWLVAAVMEAGGESALFGSPGDAGGSADGRTPLHLAACHADGAAIAAMASRDAAVPLDWTTARDNRGRTPSFVACSVQSRLVTSASLAALDARMRFIETSARAAVAAVCEELRSEGWLVPSLRCAEAASRLPPRLPRNVLETAAALTRRMLADAEAAEDAQLADDEDDDDATSLPQADADNIDDDIDAVAVPRDSLAVRLGFTEVYAAFSFDAFERAVPTIVAERLLITCLAAVARRRACPGGCPPGSPPRAPCLLALAAAARAGDAAAAAACGADALATEVRHGVHSTLDVWSLAATAAVVILFASWPRVRTLLGGASSSSADESSAAAPGGRRGRAVRHLHAWPLRARVATPLLALAWLHTFVVAPASTETASRIRLASLLDISDPSELPRRLVLALAHPAARLVVLAPAFMLPLPIAIFVVLHAAKAAAVAFASAPIFRAFPLRLAGASVWLPASARACGILPAWLFAPAAAAVACCAAARAERRALYAFCDHPPSDAPSNAAAARAFASEIGSEARLVWRRASRLAARTFATHRRGATHREAPFRRFLAARAARSAGSLAAHCFGYVAMILATAAFTRAGDDAHAAPFSASRRFAAAFFPHYPALSAGASVGAVAVSSLAAAARSHRLHIAAAAPEQRSQQQQQQPRPRRASCCDEVGAAPPASLLRPDGCSAAPPHRPPPALALAALFHLHFLSVAYASRRSACLPPPPSFCPQHPTSNFQLFTFFTFLTLTFRLSAQ